MLNEKSLYLEWSVMEKLHTLKQMCLQRHLRFLWRKAPKRKEAKNVMQMLGLNQVIDQLAMATCVH